MVGSRWWVDKSIGAVGVVCGQGDEGLRMGGWGGGVQMVGG